MSCVHLASKLSQSRFGPISRACFFHRAHSSATCADTNRDWHPLGPLTENEACQSEKHIVPEVELKKTFQVGIVHHNTLAIN